MVLLLRPACAEADRIFIFPNQSSMRTIIWLMAACLFGIPASAQQTLSNDTAIKKKDLPELMSFLPTVPCRIAGIPQQVARRSGFKIRFGSFPTMAEVLQNSGTLFVKEPAGEGVR